MSSVGSQGGWPSGIGFRDYRGRREDATNAAKTGLLGSFAGVLTSAACGRNFVVDGHRALVGEVHGDGFRDAGAYACARATIAHSLRQTWGRASASFRSKTPAPQTSHSARSAVGFPVLESRESGSAKPSTPTAVGGRFPTHARWKCQRITSRRSGRFWDWFALDTLCKVRS